MEQNIKDTKSKRKKSDTKPPKFQKSSKQSKTTFQTHKDKTVKFQANSEKSTPIKPASFALFICLVVVPFFSIIHLLPEDLLRPYIEKDENLYSFIQKPELENGRSELGNSNQPENLKNALKALVNFAEEYHDEKDIADLLSKFVQGINLNDVQDLQKVKDELQTQGTPTMPPNYAANGVLDDLTGSDVDSVGPVPQRIRENISVKKKILETELENEPENHLEKETNFKNTEQEFTAEEWHDSIQSDKKRWRTQKLLNSVNNQFKLNRTTSHPKTKNIPSKQNPFRNQHKNVTNQEKAYPEMIIVGVKKCGTGALAKFLTMHPMLKYAGEVYYFNRYRANSLIWYLKHMPDSGSGDMTFEKTPSYLFSSSVADAIYKFNPDIKIVSIMCDPVRRVYSDFLHMHRFDIESATMENFKRNVDEGMDYIRNLTSGMQKSNTTWQDIWRVNDFRFSTKSNSFGQVILRSAYSVYLKKWYSLFPRGKNMITIDGSRLYKNPGKVLVELQDFLGLDMLVNENNFYFDEERGLYCQIRLDGKAKCAGKGKGRSIQKDVPDEVKGVLRRFLDPFTKELEAIEQKSFSHWDW